MRPRLCSVHIQSLNHITKPAEIPQSTIFQTGSQSDREALYILERQEYAAGHVPVAARRGWRTRRRAFFLLVRQIRRRLVRTHLEVRVFEHELHKANADGDDGPTL